MYYKQTEPTPITEWSALLIGGMESHLERFDGPNLIRLWPPVDERKRPRWYFTITDRNYDGEMCSGWDDTYDDADLRSHLISGLLNHKKVLDSATGVY